MKKIHGRIVVKETNSGVPNLVVAAHDSERAPHALISDHLTSGGFPPGFIDQLGKSLGSVLTDPNGEFELSREDLAFPGNEARPDLLLIAFAPEDIQGLAQPFPLPPEKRILYISAVPRTDAGSEEAYIIRLVQAQLDNFQISVGVSSTSKSAEISSTNFLNAIENTYAFHDNLKQKLGPRLQAQVDNAARVKALANEKLKNFSAIPMSLRAHPLLVRDLTQVEGVQKQLMMDSVARLNSAPAAYPDVGPDLIRVRTLAGSSILPDDLLNKYLLQSDKTTGTVTTAPQ